MFQGFHTQSVALAVFFTFCQVIGTMCTLPDLWEAEATTSLVSESMACPMDRTIMCPTSVTSSKERQVKNGAVVAVDHGPNVFGLDEVQRVSSVPAQWSRSRAGSIASIPIGFFSVLRI
ncbi:MAG: hypothetical protein ACT4O4_04975 [Nitrospiraceae bacterium]